MSIKEIKEYDENNNIIYLKSPDGFELWQEYNENKNLIHYKCIDEYEILYEYWREYDENNNLIYYKTSDGSEHWYKYDINNKRIYITEEGYKEIEFRKKIKEYNSRTKCSRFELMEI